MEEALRTFMGAFGGELAAKEASRFSIFFGGGMEGGRRRRPQREQARRPPSGSPFEEAATGHGKRTRDPKLSSPARPAAVQAPNRKPGSKRAPPAKAKGQIYQSRGFFSMSSTCPHCNGAGQVITDPCKNCNGAGRIKEKQRIKIRIPAGVDNGMRLKMSGYGDAGEDGGPPGDLYVYIEVEPHEAFKREGDDVYLDLPVTFPEAALGCKKEVPTPFGETVRIQVPEGTQNGKLLRVSGKGFPNVHGQGQGDLLVRMTVETPVKLTEKQKTILRSFEKLETPSNHPRKKGFLEKIKVFFSE